MILENNVHDQETAASVMTAFDFANEHIFGNNSSMKLTVVLVSINSSLEAMQKGMMLHRYINDIGYLTYYYNSLLHYQRWCGSIHWSIIFKTSAIATPNLESYGNASYIADID